ncbi:hypothetical protein [Arthrobacter sp. UYCo732]|uniref:hypothetical protein n=1 Tax=Arthrobacter sp. UYCo732 TaxID=3156336 RepID=UPI0033942EC8
MTPHTEADARSGLRTRHSFPANIFVPAPVTPPHPALSRLDGPRRMLRHPGFWALMLVLTALMVVGALLLSDHLRSTSQPPQPREHLTYALPA